MSEEIGEACSRMHLHDQFWQIESGQTRVDRRTEIEAVKQAQCIGDFAVVFPEFGKISVVVRFREGADTLDGCTGRLLVDQVEDSSAHGVIGRFGIENDYCRVPQLQRCSIEIAQRPQTSLFGG